MGMARRAVLGLLGVGGAGWVMFGPSDNGDADAESNQTATATATDQPTTIATTVPPTETEVETVPPTETPTETPTQTPTETPTQTEPPTETQPPTPTPTGRTQGDIQLPLRLKSYDERVTGKAGSFNVFEDSSSGRDKLGVQWKFVDKREPARTFQPEKPEIYASARLQLIANQKQSYYDDVRTGLSAGQRHKDIFRLPWDEETDRIEIYIATRESPINE